MSNSLTVLPPYTSSMLKTFPLLPLLCCKSLPGYPSHQMHYRPSRSLFACTYLWRHLLDCARGSYLAASISLEIPHCVNTSGTVNRAFPWGISGQEDCWSRGVWGRLESQYPYELSCISNKRKANNTKTLTSVQNPPYFLHKRPFALILSIQTHVFSP